ncbi:MAG: NtaA/DmoA family FMN-dependent monooxygenase [Candidatus Microbacterium stercoravium]
MTAQSDQPRQVHLVAHFPGVNSTTVWRDPASASQIDFSSFRHFAATAERGLFDYIFLAEGLRLREHAGRIHDLDVAGRPPTPSILAALAANTPPNGVVGTLSSTFNEPYELARQLATIDHLSGGRVGWNVVTSSDAFHGANFRRGGFLDHGDRYVRAEEFVRLAKQLWDSWAPDAVVADAERGAFVDPERVGAVRFSGEQFDIAATSTVPRSPQGYPVIVQAGDSPAGRDFAAANAEIIFSRHASFEEGRSFYADVKGRLGAVGREENSLLILPAVSYVLGDTLDDARDRSRQISLDQIGPETAVAWVEAIWGQELPGLDPDGPLPTSSPVEATQRAGQASLGVEQRIGYSRRLRERAEGEQLSVREVVIAETARHGFVGTAESVAADIDRHVQERASDGFVLAPHLTPTGLDEFVDKVVPRLQERGVFRTRYGSDEDPQPTLRSTLGLPEPLGPDTAPAAQLAGAARA